MHTFAFSDWSETKLKDFKMLPEEVQTEYEEINNSQVSGKRRKLYAIVNKYVRKDTDRG